MANLLPQDNLARALDLHGAGRLEEASAMYRQIVAAEAPFAADAAANLGVIEDDAGRHEEALRHYRHSLRLKGDNPLTLNNMGNSLLKLGRFPEAASAFRQALLNTPELLEARIGLGAALQRQGDAAAAIACFREVVQRDPACAEAHWNLALALLISGNFREGWTEYQWRWRKESFTSPQRAFTQPLWDGSALNGRRILIHAEQGLGDTIQFMRYLPLVQGMGGTVVVECQSPSLCPLLQGIAGVSGVFAMGEPLPHFDLHAPLLSLPHLFDTTLDTIPNAVPYLAADPERLSLWGKRLEEPDHLKVGVVWAGKPLPDRFRSCRLEDLAPLANVPGAAFYSLQMGESGGDLRNSSPLDIIDLTSHISDFADTAALVSHLDLVISVDTSVAHLAGALGKPVWLLLPKAGDYRWMLGREDSPWYPTMRIFRQERQGEWGAVLQRVAGALTDAAWRFVETSASAAPLNGRRVYLCGESLAAQGRHGEAVVRFNKAAQLLCRQWEPHYSIAQSLQAMGLLDQARQSLETALLLRDDLALLHESLGVVTQLQGDHEAAKGCYRNALALDPASVKARFNLATIQRLDGDYAAAMDGFREVIRLSPGHGDAHWNLAVLLLLTGDLEGGWREFPWRYRKSGRPPVARWQDRPRWEGGPLEGKTILLHCEEGLGDTLQFVRYAPLVAARGGRVLMEVHSPALAAIVSRVEGVAGVVVEGALPPPFDLQASLLDLPALFGTGLGTIPATIPYLHHDPALLARMQQLVPRDGSFRVGMVWSGNPAHNNDARRSIPFPKLAPLADLPGVACYSLQVGSQKEEDLSTGPELRHVTSSIRDFSDTAALAAQLDLIITVDTSVAHLCGGLGLPVWVMLPFVPDWRWLLGRDDSPWYPTMRLFRQQSPGDWEGVIARVRGSLAAEIAGFHGSAREDHKSLGHSLSEQGRFLEAAREFERALSVTPRDVELLNDLGCALDNAGRHPEAVEAYSNALKVAPEFMPLHYNMGNSLKSIGRADEAVQSYRRALALHPTLPEGWHNLGLALQDTGDLTRAQEALERALQLRPGYLEARHNLGELHQMRGDLDAALLRFREVLALDPRYLPSWNALGIAMQIQDRLDEAVACYERALSVDPDYLHALNNLGAAWKALGRLEEARGCYRRVIGLDPEYADARWNLALVQLLQGEYEEGWRGYEWRFRKVDPVRRRELPQPLWDGTPLNGRTILLHAEQGFGDAIQFVRYAADVARMGGEVLVECQTKGVAPVIASVPGVSKVLVRGETLPPFHVHAPLMSLPHLCGTTLATIPADVPYMTADPQLVELWRGRISRDGFRVGLVWAGRKSYKDDRKRTLMLDLFAPLGRVPRVRFYSLQVGQGVEQAASPPPGLEIASLGGAIETFADTAAIIENLDLVISADTAVAHLAGALGKAVWVLLPMVCDWRWLLDRDDSPWYPSARLFRQRRRGEWGEVLDRVAQALAETVPLHCHSRSGSDRESMPVSAGSWIPDKGSRGWQLG